ncbi:hypothetical protein PUR61_00605 [Streptomyces sp. BE20]|uniref:hypothetical protein n=1 Tax=Streptomyces sp. BE20 TaxID=3002525 RepID=UPI002E77943A|nr:hypothetical protein [Streptomyces sp. BE20]MEE1820715.1 hypothetical protein [Streptomyces sp. BE20]
MASKRLAAAVHLSHPTTGERLILLPGDQVPPELAALITHADAFQPDPEAEHDGDGSGDADAADDPPAKPARARRARTDTE